MLGLDGCWNSSRGFVEYRFFVPPILSMIELLGAIYMTLTGTDAPKVPAPRQILSTTIYVFELAIVASIYVGLASTAPLFPPLNALQTPLWPPSGAALAIMLLRGYRTWPAVFIGSFSARAISVCPVEIQSLAIAGGTTLGA